MNETQNPSESEKPENPSDTELFDWLYTRANCTLHESRLSGWTLMLDINYTLSEWSAPTPREAIAKAKAAVDAWQKGASK
jgi:hypothetical protein